MCLDVRIDPRIATAILVAAQLLLRDTQAQSPQLLGAVTFEVTSVTDSGQYFLYGYRIVNPSSSRGGWPSWSSTFRRRLVQDTKSCRSLEISSRMVGATSITFPLAASPGSLGDAPNQGAPRLARR